MKPERALHVCVLLKGKGICSCCLQRVRLEASNKAASNSLEANGERHACTLKPWNPGAGFCPAGDTRPKTFSQRIAGQTCGSGLLSSGLEPRLRRPDGSLQRDSSGVSETQC